jgi:hypothetical protein
MRPFRRNGVSTGEILLFLAVLGLGVVVLVYLNQKPQIVERTIVIENQAPASPAPTPAPPPKIAPVVTPPPAQIRAEVEAPPQLPEIVVMAKPPVPACVAIEKRLKIALQAAIQTSKDIDAATQAALDRIHQSPDYLSAKADLEDKKKAKEDALNALRHDDAAGNDTDQDTANVQAASLAWATQSGVVTRLENEAVDNDETINRKLQDLKDLNFEIAKQQKQMEDYIYREIVSVCDRTACQINDVRLDPDRWNIQVDMTPENQSNPGAMADAALNNVGTVLETLSKSPIPWNEIRFRICGQTSNIVQYQLTYSHGAIAEANFDLLHINSLLYRPIHNTELHIGVKGILLDVEIMSIVDENNMIVWPDESDEDAGEDVRPVWIRGINTTGKVDDSVCDIMTPLVVTKTVRYLTLSGAYKTIYMLEPTGFNENIVIGDYYDNNKLVAIAQGVWLNPAIDHLQGREALPDYYVRQPGTKSPELYDTLRIGGYVRSDGTTCPVTLVHSPHVVTAAEIDPPTNRTPSLPSGYGKTNPLITSSPPPAGF